MQNYKKMLSDPNFMKISMNMNFYSEVGCIPSII